MSFETNHYEALKRIVALETELRAYKRFLTDLWGWVDDSDASDKKALNHVYNQIRQFKYVPEGSVGDGEVDG